MPHDEHAPLVDTKGDNNDAPEDTYNITYFVLLFLGVALLLTYNSFVACPGYTSHYYRYAAQDENLNATMPSVWQNISPFITTANMIPNLIFQIAMLSNRVQQIPVMKRLYFSVILNAVAMVIVPVMPAFKIGEHAALAVLLIGDAICGAATAMLQSSAFAIAAQFPMLQMQATMLGIGVSGTVVSLLQIITYGAIGSSFSAVLEQSSVFFGIGVLALFILVFILPAFRRNEFARHYVLEWRNEDDARASRANYIKHSVTASLPALGTHGSHLGSQQQNQNQPNSSSDDLYRTGPMRTSDADAGGVYVSGSQQQQHSQHYPSNTAGGAAEPMDSILKTVVQPDVDVLHVLGLCKWNMLANFYIYFITLLVYPGLGVAVDKHSDWYGIIIIFLYNFGDFSGRMLCRFEMFLLKGKDRWLQLASACRTIFFPLFLISVKPKLIEAPALPMIFMFLTGITNGFTSSQLMMFTPSMDELKPHERPVAGSAMSLSLLTGCSVGSLVALAISQTYLD